MDEPFSRALLIVQQYLHEQGYSAGAWSRVAARDRVRCKSSRMRPPASGLPDPPAPPPAPPLPAAALSALEAQCGLLYDSTKYSRGGELLELVYRQFESELAAEADDPEHAQRQAEREELLQAGAPVPLVHHPLTGVGRGRAGRGGGGVQPRQEGWLAGTHPHAAAAWHPLRARTHNTAPRAPTTHCRRASLSICPPAGRPPSRACTAPP